MDCLFHIEEQVAAVAIVHEGLISHQHPTQSRDSAWHLHRPFVNIWHLLHLHGLTRFLLPSQDSRHWCYQLDRHPCSRPVHSFHCSRYHHRSDPGPNNTSQTEPGSQQNSSIQCRQCQDRCWVRHVFADFIEVNFYRLVILFVKVCPSIKVVVMIELPASISNLGEFDCGIGETSDG